jgi:hypothetical protein
MLGTFSTSPDASRLLHLPLPLVASLSTVPYRQHLSCFLSTTYLPVVRSISGDNSCRE